VFLRLKEANLRIKCEFYRQELLHLGHRVTSHEIGTDADKGADIAQVDPPSTVHELRQYIGVVS